MNNPPISFPIVAPLVSSTEQKGTRLTCVFTCPVTSKTAIATVDVVKANGESLQLKVKSRLRTSAIQSATKSAGSALRRLFGSNVVGRLANEIVQDKGKAVQNSGGFSEAEMQQATLAAFEEIRAQFAWCTTREGLVHSSVLKAPANDRTVRCLPGRRLHTG